MPWYNDLRPESDFKDKDFALIFPRMTVKEKIRCIDNIVKLNEVLDKEIPKKVTDKNLLIATWNIKELGHNTQRLPESFFYLAEIINRFDLISIQEVKSTLKDFEILKRMLGSDWQYLINDITEGKEGNSERSAYLFNTKRVKTSGLAGEIVLWDDLTRNSDVKQLKRSPYITGFIAGWKNFEMINVHLHPGEDAEDFVFRGKEVDLLMQAIKFKVERNRLWSDNLILNGDMNLYHASGSNEKDRKSIELITAQGFKELDSLSNINTNATQTQAYDRLFFHVNEFFKVAKKADGKDSGGIFKVFDFIFSDNDFNIYKENMVSVYGGEKDMNVEDNLKKYFRNTWRKNQISDHYPVWSEILIDSSIDFLLEKKAELLDQP